MRVIGFLMSAVNGGSAAFEILEHTFLVTSQSFVVVVVQCLDSVAAIPLCPAAVVCSFYNSIQSACSKAQREILILRNHRTYHRSFHS